MPAIPIFVPAVRELSKITMRKCIKKSSVLWFLLSVLLILSDQIVKQYVAAHCRLFEQHTLIPGVLDFFYLQNEGAALGIFQGARWFFVVLTVPVMILCVVLLFSRRFSSQLFAAAISLIIAGGTGNLIDRILYGYVVDFIRFPVSWFSYSFNIADCCMVIGAGLLILYFLIDTIRSIKNGGRHGGDGDADNHPSGDGTGDMPD